MPKAYIVFSYQSAPDPQKLAAYGKLAIPASEPFGARLLARGNAAAAYERGLKERILIIEFPSLEKAIAPPIRKRLKRSVTVPCEIFGSSKAWSKTPWRATCRRSNFS
jgi:uncharacterized protein (DUF1330 family)